MPTKRRRRVVPEEKFTDPPRPARPAFTVVNPEAEVTDAEVDALLALLLSIAANRRGRRKVSK